MSASQSKPLKVIGLIGGVASGKSLVAQEFARLGARVLDADRAGHAVLLEPAIERAARERWGNTIFSAGGHIERPKLAAIVFAKTPAGRAELAYLEQLTHPRIGERLREELRSAAEAGVRVAILDAPVLLKAGWNRFCDRLVFVDANRQQRVERARGRGWSEAEFDDREAAQESVASKAAKADLRIDNSASVAETRAQVERLWDTLTE